MTQIKTTYIQHCGDDLIVVNAARVSFEKFHKEYEDNDTGLIKYLAREKHLSPFNHTWLTFHVKAPIFVARQLVKHEYMPWNEVSRRYVDSEPEFYTPDVWRERSADKKQGSGGACKSQYFPNIYAEEVTAKALGDYKKMLQQGVSPEQARMILPQSTMTEWYWSGTLGAFAKMCNLRCKPDTQYESRVVADQISEKVAELFPVSWAALMGGGG
jgi:thymidylate synthase (FAD)